MYNKTTSRYTLSTIDNKGSLNISQIQPNSENYTFRGSPLPYSEYVGIGLFTVLDFYKIIQCKDDREETIPILIPKDIQPISTVRNIYPLCILYHVSNETIKNRIFMYTKSGIKLRTQWSSTMDSRDMLLFSYFHNIQIKEWVIGNISKRYKIDESILRQINLLQPKLKNEYDLYNSTLCYIFYESMQYIQEKVPTIFSINWAIKSSFMYQKYSSQNPYFSNTESQTFLPGISQYTVKKEIYYLYVSLHMLLKYCYYNTIAAITSSNSNTVNANGTNNNSNNAVNTNDTNNNNNNAVNTNDTNNNNNNAVNTNDTNNNNNNAVNTNDTNNNNNNAVNTNDTNNNNNNTVNTNDTNNNNNNTVNANVTNNNNNNTVNTNDTNNNNNNTVNTNDTNNNNNNTVNANVTNNNNNNTVNANDTNNNNNNTVNKSDNRNTTNINDNNTNIYQTVKVIRIRIRFFLALYEYMNTNNIEKVCILDNCVLFGNIKTIEKNKIFQYDRWLPYKKLELLIERICYTTINKNGDNKYICNCSSECILPKQFQNELYKLQQLSSGYWKDDEKNIRRFLRHNNYISGWWILGYMDKFSNDIPISKLYFNRTEDQITGSKVVDLGYKTVFKELLDMKAETNKAVVLSVDEKYDTMTDSKYDTTTEPKNDTTTEPKNDTITESKNDTITESKNDTTTEPKNKTTTEPKNKTTTEPKNDNKGINTKNEINYNTMLYTSPINKIILENIFKTHRIVEMNEEQEYNTLYFDKLSQRMENLLSQTAYIQQIIYKEYKNTNDVKKVLQDIIIKDTDDIDMQSIQHRMQFSPYGQSLNSVQCGQISYMPYKVPIFTTLCIGEPHKQTIKEIKKIYNDNNTINYFLTRTNTDIFIRKSSIEQNSMKQSSIIDDTTNVRHVPGFTVLGGIDTLYKHSSNATILSIESNHSILGELSYLEIDGTIKVIDWIHGKGIYNTNNNSWWVGDRDGTLSGINRNQDKNINILKDQKIISRNEGYKTLESFQYPPIPDKQTPEGFYQNTKWQKTKSAKYWNGESIQIQDKNENENEILRYNRYQHNYIPPRDIQDIRKTRNNKNIPFPYWGKISYGHHPRELYIALPHTLFQLDQRIGNKNISTLPSAYTSICRNPYKSINNNNFIRIPLQLEGHDERLFSLTTSINTSIPYQCSISTKTSVQMYDLRKICKQPLLRMEVPNLPRVIHINDGNRAKHPIHSMDTVRSIPCRQQEFIEITQEAYTIPPKPIYIERLHDNLEYNIHTSNLNLWNCNKVWQLPRSYRYIVNDDITTTTTTTTEDDDTAKNNNKLPSHDRYNRILIIGSNLRYNFHCFSEIYPIQDSTTVCSSGGQSVFSPSPLTKNIDKIWKNITLPLIGSSQIQFKPTIYASDTVSSTLGLQRVSSTGIITCELFKYQDLYSDIVSNTDDVVDSVKECADDADITIDVCSDTASDTTSDTASDTASDTTSDTINVSDSIDHNDSTKDDDKKSVTDTETNTNANTNANTNTNTNINTNTNRKNYDTLKKKTKDTNVLQTNAHYVDTTPIFSRLQKMYGKENTETTTNISSGVVPYLWPQIKDTKNNTTQPNTVKEIIDLFINNSVLLYNFLQFPRTLHEFASYQMVTFPLFWRVQNPIESMDNTDIKNTNEIIRPIEMICKALRYFIPSSTVLYLSLLQKDIVDKKVLLKQFSIYCHYQIIDKIVETTCIDAILNQKDIINICKCNITKQIHIDELITDKENKELLEYGKRITGIYDAKKINELKSLHPISYLHLEYTKKCLYVPNVCDSDICINLQLCILYTVLPIHRFPYKTRPNNRVQSIDIIDSYESTTAAEYDPTLDVEHMRELLSGNSDKKDSVDAALDTSGPPGESILYSLEQMSLEEQYQCLGIKRRL